MRKARDIAFALCAAAVLCASLVHGVALEAAPDGVESKSFLEGRVYQMRPDFSTQAFLDGIYQGQTEQYAADLVPARDSALLASAGLQRLGIATANLPFGYPAYPTFFDSAYLVCPAYGAVVEMPRTQRNATPQMLADAAASFAAAMQAHDDVNWAFGLVDRSRISLANPAHGLVSQPADYPYYQQGFLPFLPGSCAVLDLSNADADAYFARYFRTDHHWQATGGYEAYRQAMQAFGRKPLEAAPAQAYAGPFYGSEARSGLITAYADAIVDVEPDTAVPALSVEVDGQPADASWLDEALGEGWSGSYVPEERFANGYAEHFHGDVGHIRIVNPKGKGALLVVGDSFTNCMDRLFAYSYREVHIVDPRYSEAKLGEFLEKHPVDDAVFILASNTLFDKSMRPFLEG